ncbi:MAG TPA: cytochrome P450 [Polyangiaceae bacterium]|nr:cytochrome P450 [Polyangiaceae bacterium]
MTMSTKPPRPRGPALFTVLDIGRDQLDGPIRYFDQLGDTFQISFLGRPLIASRDPLLFEDVLIREHKRFIKDEITRGLSKLVGQGLLTSDREPWKKHRRILAPHFQAAEIATYLAVFREEAERELERWTPGSTVELHRAMARLSMRIALRTVFGADSEMDEDLEPSMRDAMLFFVGVAGTAITLPLALPTPTNRRFIRAREHLNATVRRLITRARERGAGNSVLQSLLEARESGELSEQQLVDEGITMLVAGHETSALAMTYTLALLGDRPDEQRAIQEELDAEFPDTLERLRRPSHLNRALRESFRLYPEAWAVGREALEDCQVAGFDVARGSQVFLYQWAAHRHPHWFSDPERFRPERWTAEFESTLPRCLYAPFGAGPRLCIGNLFAIAEVTIALATFLSRLDFQAIRPFVPRLVPALTLRPQGPVPIVPRARAR